MFYYFFLLLLFPFQLTQTVRYSDLFSVWHLIRLGVCFRREEKNGKVYCEFHPIHLSKQVYFSIRLFRIPPGLMMSNPVWWSTKDFPYPKTVKT